MAAGDSSAVPRVRRVAIPDDAVLVVRGDDLDPQTARAQAVAFRRRFPDWNRWGLSAFYARSEAEVDDSLLTSSSGFLSW